MAGKSRIDVRLATQILVLQLIIVTLTLIVAFGLVAVFNRQRLDSQYHVHALDMARVVASSPSVINNISRYDDAALTASPALIDELAAGPIQSVASRVEQRTHVRFVVVVNTHGIRLADPDRNRLGLHVLADITQAAAGHEGVTHDSTFLGRAIVAKVPVLQPGSNRALGVVIVGLSTQAFDEQFSKKPARAGSDGWCGDLLLASPGNAELRLSGAEFIARLPGVMVEEAQWVTQT